MLGMPLIFARRKWGLSKVMCIIIDNASSNDSAISQLKKRLLILKKNAFVVGGDAFHMRCCAHIIQLVVMDRLDAVQGSIRRIRDVVKHVNRYNNRFQVEFWDELPSEFDWHNARILCNFLEKFYDVT
ncbi:hypothetical protein GH714_004968 [Hevea brasiliensis]|uniref:hAT-like transposase RNase-H fold domain-containing protein n=1 Tax=Hevea brasiliensis TaxID=3981 RepID=A0A6A6LQM7_HEVBR|nr:hypothetical protein GH714_004968 [Hevea brasiliensis]